MIMSQSTTPDDDLLPFVCTLAEAAQRDPERRRAFKTVTDLIDRQAQQHPEAFALGFPESAGSADWTTHLFTFKQLRNLTCVTGSWWQDRLSHGHESESSTRTIGLLGSSTASFLFTWLGLVYQGYSVLLLAPQNGPDAIANLCKACGVTQLIHEEKNSALAEQSCQSEVAPTTLRLHELPESIANLRDATSHVSPQAPRWRAEETDSAYIHHSSGTSGGLPKPLPVSHEMAVGVLPVPKGTTESFVTLSTTPLYHGGVADCFRSWSAASMIWLFPGTSPVTAEKVIKCIRLSTEATWDIHAPVINYFSCVPQVLNIVADDPEGIKYLQDMKMVGVGGAAMPPGLATRLVEDKVSLVSRYGSTECGFLMSSHRDYENDKAWDFLRQDPTWPLKFEAHQNGLAELVVLPSWPALKHHNRSDGSFATADLFESHPTIPRAWKFNSRADAQLTLVTGKKFDAAPIEDAIRESPLIKDILIFGEGQTFPGAFLYSHTDLNSEEQSGLRNQLWSVIETQNQKNPPHARLPKSMLVFLPADAPPLRKSIKGTTLRKPAYKAYEEYIAAAYANQASQTGHDGKEENMTSISDSNVQDFLAGIIQDQAQLSSTLRSDDDLFNLGIDSNMALMIRGRIQRSLRDSTVEKLPINVIYDCGTLSRLTNFIIAFRHGQQVDGQGEKANEIEGMLDLVREHATWPEPVYPFDSKPAEEDGSERQNDPSEVFLLTGATGTLGAHILAQVRASPNKPQIHCLVRGSSLHAARERIDRSLQQRGLAGLNSADDRIHVHPCKLGELSLGLESEVYSSLCRSVTHIVHAAWAVNFTMRLTSFVKDHIIGIHNLLNFALLCEDTRAAPRFSFCSSMATAVGSRTLHPVPEIVNSDPWNPQAMGYPRSKWVAEQICLEARTETKLGSSVQIIRIGQLCGDTCHGIWNTTEAWPLMLSSVTLTKSLPDISTQPLDWLPVDIAARAVLEIATTNSADNESYRAYNILNTSEQATWGDLFGWLRKVSPGLEIIPPAEWVTRLDALQGEGQQHPAFKLLDLWRKAYCDPQSAAFGTSRPTFVLEYTTDVAPTMRDVAPIGEEHFSKIWAWLQRETNAQKS